MCQQDNASIATIIQTVSAEFGLGAADGFAVGDAGLSHLYDVYQAQQGQYWVVVGEHNQVVGGGGVAPLQGESSVLEIQKMYFLPEARGQGFAAKILMQCFEWGHQHGYQRFYLETTSQLQAAIGLYERMGFQYLTHPLGNTGHSAACEIYMCKEQASI